MEDSQSVTLSVIASSLVILLSMVEEFLVTMSTLRSLIAPLATTERARMEAVYTVLGVMQLLPILFYGIIRLHGGDWAMKWHSSKMSLSFPEGTLITFHQRLRLATATLKGGLKKYMQMRIAHSFGAMETSTLTPVLLIPDIGTPTAPLGMKTMISGLMAIII